jgi:Domain of Unknown Function (DUF1080)
MKSIVVRVYVPCCVFILFSFATTWAGSAPPGDWKPLFNGKDLTGWSVAAGRGGANATPANWKVEDGVLVGGQGSGRGSLVTNEQFKDFDLQLDFQLAEHGTQCSPERTGPEQANASVDKTCTYNSGVSFRTGYQVNIGRREAGEYIGIVVHRVSPKGLGPQHNVLWLDTGDEKFPGLRKKEQWNHLEITAKGPHLTVELNGKKICDVMDDPTDPAEAKWKEAGPISLQWPPAGEAGGFEGYVKYRNIKIREL